MRITPRTPSPPAQNLQATGGYFRAHARNEAHFNRKLCGALKELDQGETEIIVEGKTSAIRSFLRWCRKGPGKRNFGCPVRAFNAPCDKLFVRGAGVALSVCCYCLLFVRALSRLPRLARTWASCCLFSEF